jgi:hypothetical protein
MSLTARQLGKPGPQRDAFWLQCTLPDFGERSLSELDATMRVHGADEAQIALRKVGDDLLKNMRKAISDDPLGWADRTGMMPVPPIDFGSKTPRHRCARVLRPPRRSPRTTAWRRRT